MDELKYYLEQIFADDVVRVIISNPRMKSEPVNKIVAEKKQNGWQIASYTQKQVFHENVSGSLNKTSENSQEDGNTVLEISSRLFELALGNYKQINAFSATKEHVILISKKGACNYKVKRIANDTIRVAGVQAEHNRKKNYILEEGTKIEPLIDMGIFTKEGRVVNSMYDKYKQINRFIEILDDEIPKRRMETLHVIDFGCGKSYLTFIVYYYLTQIRGLKVEMIGLDLKEDVIKKCNQAAQKYGYVNLRFEMGDINGYHAPFDVDMVITLHACDTATDFALYNAICWNADMIFSVPCCQHELNGQIRPEKLEILSRYGIVKERFCALATDAIRANLLEYCGYKTQLLEFIDFEHTPKNIMIRAVKRPMMARGSNKKYLDEVEAMRKEFLFEPKLYTLLEEKFGQV